MCKKAVEFGYNGLELACWGDHFEVDKADEAYCQQKLDLLKKYNLKLYAISTHLVGQCVADNIDDRHKGTISGATEIQKEFDKKQLRKLQKPDKLQNVWEIKQ